jgi:cytochrome P450 family 6
MGMKVFSNTNNSVVKRILTVTYPDLARKLHIKTTSDDVEEFFMKIVKDVVEYRETNKIKRNDFMDLLLQLKNDGILANDEKLTIEEIAAQAFVFFLAVKKLVNLNLIN